MPYTASYFEPARFRPDAFLGEAMDLPELAGFTPRMRAIWERPILSFEQASEFMELSGWFAPGYDQKLAQCHWGVFTARTLEAMFFRLADLVADKPLWKRKEEGDIAYIQVHCESGAMHNLARDLTVSFFHPPGTDPANEDYMRQAQNPPGEGEYLTSQDEGNARVRAFWAPLEVGMVVQALLAWEATRFTDHRDERGKLRRFGVDVQLLRAQGPIAAMGALFGPAFRARVQATELARQTLAPKAAIPSPRL